MDGARFDRLTRALASRRTLLGTLTGLLAPLAPGTQPAAAGCRGSGQVCANQRQCCPGSRCRKGRCRCRTALGFRPCNGPGLRCVNTKTSEQHCGNCDAACPRRHHICHDGRCIDHCRSGVRDKDETGRDCGGDRCPKCGVGERCRVDGDCRSGACAGGRCVLCETDAQCAPFLSLAPFCVNNVCRPCRTDDHCPSGQFCVGGSCEGCTPLGFGSESACTSSDQCCDDGICVPRSGGGLRCRPATCVPDGGPCDVDDIESVRACCSGGCQGSTCTSL